MNLFEDIIDSWFTGYVSGQNLNTLLNSLVKLYFESFIGYFKQITLEMFSSWDVGIIPQKTSIILYLVIILISIIKKDT